MIKNVIKYIFIYTLSILFIGCDSILTTNDSCEYCFLEVEAPDLPMNENGIYQLDFNNESLQTFTQLRAYIGYEYEYVGWGSDTHFQGCTWGHCEDVPIVNGSTYSCEDGYAYTMVGVYEENIGDIATIWVGYIDDYGQQHLDSIRIMINE